MNFACLRLNAAVYRNYAVSKQACVVILGL